MTVLNHEGGPCGGPWNIFIERDGEYEIGLRRWLPRLDIALDAACSVQKKRKGELPEGPALPIAKAQLLVADQEQAVKTEPGAKVATFRVTLKGGQKTQLHGWLQDRYGKDLCGAYYAQVRRV